MGGFRIGGESDASGARELGTEAARVVSRLEVGLFVGDRGNSAVKIRGGFDLLSFPMHILFAFACWQVSRFVLQVSGAFLTGFSQHSISEVHDLLEIKTPQYL